MPRYCLSRLAAAIAACLILFISLPVAFHASAEGNIVRAAEGGATSGACGADWAQPCDLQYALRTVAQPGDEIWVKAGTYYPTTNPTDRNASFALRGGINVYGGFAGTETARDQRDWKANQTILSGDIDHNDLASPAQSADQIQGANSLHVVYGYDVIVDAILDGFIITAGQGTDTEGGGVLISVSGTHPPESGTAHLSNVHIMGSRARNGGGVYLNHSGILTDVLITDCTVDQDGGGIDIYGEPVLTRVTIAGSTALRGGGMSITYGSPTLTDVTFTENAAAITGGGLYAYYSDSLITGAIFQDNFANESGGGAYFSNAIPQISGATFENNRTNGQGGGVYTTYTTQFAMADSLITGNLAQSGGGLYAFESGVDLVNVTIHGNAASQYGGGIRMDTPTTDYRQLMRHLTITENGATAGSGLYVSGKKQLELVNSIVQNKISGLFTVRYTVLNDPYSSGVDVRYGNPYLGPLTDVGGRVRVRPLGPGSSAINFSDPALCPAADARGVSRQQGAGCDAGAYESRPFQVNISGGDGQSVPVFRFFPQPLSVTVTGTDGDPVSNGQVHVVSSDPAYIILSNSNLPLSGGKASITARAGWKEGSYSVWVVPFVYALPGDPGSAELHLTNTAAEPAVLRATVNGSSAFTPCGESWAKPCSLENAIKVAGWGDQIWVRAGTYYPKAPLSLPDKAAIYGGFAGTETTLGARQWESNVTILSGDTEKDDLASPITDISQIRGSNVHSIFDAYGCTDCVLDGFTLTAAEDSALKLRNCQATLRNLIIQGNIGSTGGGLDSHFSELQLSNVTFRYNHATRSGGGSYSYLSNELFERVTYTENSAEQYGGGAYTLGASSYDSIADMKDMAFLNNTAAMSGGGLVVDDGEVLLEGGLFLNNQAPTGGGLFLKRGREPIKFSNTTFYGNAATTRGGAIAFPSLTSVQYFLLVNSTIVGNTAPQGGGIDADFLDVDVHNSILWGNTGGQIAQAGSYSEVYDSIVQGGFEGGENILTADPLLAPLGSYGGGTQTFALLPGSPAIDSGQESNCPETDQRGVARPQGAGCDIGAFESRGFTLTLNGGNNQSAMITEPFTTPLRVTVRGTMNEPVSGGLVTFTPPAEGASAIVTGSPAAVTVPVGAPYGLASITARANSTGGAYQLTADGPGIQPVSFQLTNLPAPAMIEASVVKSPVVYGEPLTFRAQVTASAGTPSGKVQFRLDGADFGPPVDLAGGWADLTIDPFVSIGAHELTAAYLGSESHQAAVTGQPIELVVQQAATTLAITSSANPEVLGKTITLTAVVSATAPGRGQPTGMVVFTVDGWPETSSPLKDGEAVLELFGLPAGSLTVTASYSGDDNFDASPSASFTQWVHNPVPVVAALLPASVQEGSQGFTLTIIGTGFAPGAVVRWNGIDLPTVVENSTTLKAEVSADMIRDAGEKQITVFNPEPGGGESGAVIFTVLERMRLYLPVVLQP